MAPTITSLPQPTKVRQLIGPLTTVFHPPYPCSQCTFLGAATDPAAQTYSEICAIFNPNPGPCPANEPPQCLPHVTAYSDIAGVGFFYSPGLACPDGWTSALSVTREEGSDRIRGVEVATLLPDETAVVCCPSAFTYVPAQDSLGAGYCTRPIFTSASYLSCKTSSSATEVTKTDIGESTAISYKQVTKGSTYTKTTTLLFTSVEMNAPTIQLNYRAVDISPPPSSSSHTSSLVGQVSTSMPTKELVHVSSGLSTGAIAGIVIGSVTFFFLTGLPLMFMYFRHQRSIKHTQQQRQLSAASAKPELDGTPKPQLTTIFEGQHQTSDHGNKAQRFELDGNVPPRYSHVVSANKTESGGHVRNNLSNASGVSNLSNVADGTPSSQ